MSTSTLVPDGTGIEWRRVGAAYQYRYAAACFGPDGEPGPWIEVEVAGIVHPARVAAIAKLNRPEAA